MYNFHTVVNLLILLSSLLSLWELQNTSKEIKILSICLIIFLFLSVMLNTGYNFPLLVMILTEPSESKIPAIRYLR